MSTVSDVVYGKGNFHQSSVRRVKREASEVEVVIHSVDWKLNSADLDDYKVVAINNFNKKTIVGTIVAAALIIFGLMMKSTFAVSATTVICFLVYSQRHLFRMDGRRHFE